MAAGSIGTKPITTVSSVENKTDEGRYLNAYPEVVGDWSPSQQGFNETTLRDIFQGLFLAMTEVNTLGSRKRGSGGGRQDKIMGLGRRVNSVRR